MIIFEIELAIWNAYKKDGGEEKEYSKQDFLISVFSNLPHSGSVEVPQGKEAEGKSQSSDVVHTPQVRDVAPIVTASQGDTTGLRVVRAIPTIEEPPVTPAIEPIRQAAEETRAAINAAVVEVNRTPASQSES